MSWGGGGGEKTSTYFHCVGYTPTKVDSWHNPDRTLVGLVLSQDALTRKCIYQLAEILRLRRAMKFGKDPLTPDAVVKWIVDAVDKILGRARWGDMVGYIVYVRLRLRHNT